MIIFVGKTVEKLYMTSREGIPNLKGLNEINGETPGSLNRWDRYHKITQLARTISGYISDIVSCQLGDYVVPTTY